MYYIIGMTLTSVRGSMNFLSGLDQRWGPERKRTKQINFQGELEDRGLPRFTGTSPESCFATKKGKFTI